VQKNIFATISARSSRRRSAPPRRPLASGRLTLPEPAEAGELFDVIARAYLAALIPDFRYRQTTATLDVHGFAFRASGRQPIDLGWRALASSGMMMPSSAASVVRARTADVLSGAID
jgi:DNA topoisomerase IA